MSKSEFIDIRVGETVLADRTFVYELLSGLSELHGRRCADIAACGDMEEATALAKTLEPIVFVYNDVEAAAAILDDRDPNLLGTEEEILRHRVKKIADGQPVKSRTCYLLTPRSQTARPMPWSGMMRQAKKSSSAGMEPVSDHANST